MWSREAVELQNLTSCGVLKSLKFVDHIVWKAGEHRVAVVKAGDDEGST
jgi:hypothetical protein